MMSKIVVKLTLFTQIPRKHLIGSSIISFIEPARCLWLGLYYSGRMWCSIITDWVSSDILVTSGVLKINHMVPLCLIWFVNELAGVFKFEHVLFMLLA
jgi:hypothetical protein